MSPPGFDLGKARLGELLVQRGIITADQLDETLREQKRTQQFLGTILVSKGWASEEEAARALSEQLGLAFVELISYPEDPAVVELIPESVSRARQAIPLFGLGDTLTVAMANPLDVNAIEELERVSHRHIRPVFATSSAIRRALDKGLARGIGDQDGDEEWTKVKLIGLQAAERSRASAPEALADLRAIASLAPVVQLVNALVNEAVALGASDIHLEPSPERYYCRFRIDGILRDRPELPKEYQPAIISRIKIMASMDIAEKRLPQDGRIQTEAAERLVDLRVSTFPTIHGENVVIRILDKRQGLLRLEDLGFSEAMFAQFETLIGKPHGIVLVTGPTGSGKTTTLYAALSRVNRLEKNIMTLEDPVEYELPRVCQSQVNVKAGLTFATGLRSMVRQDPDVIMIGEIRDGETADIAIHASLTGHLVFSTLHTNDAASAAMRLVDMGVEPFLTASSLIGILAQRLVRSLCVACKKTYQPAQKVLDSLGIKKAAPAFFEPAGCAQCRQTGYQGRVGIFELLVPNEKVRELIAQKVAVDVIREEAVRNGMKTLRQDGIDKAVRGVTSLAEVLRVTGEE